MPKAGRSPILYFSVILLSLTTGFCSSADIKEDARFSYQNVYKERYNEGRGGIIPLTLERGETYSGSITPDGKYLFFSSNLSGNYDLYLRPLDDVEVIPVVDTATNQKEPAISPDGEYLAYIEDELDPDGDLVVREIDPEEIVEEHHEREESYISEFFISEADNLTNDEENRVRSLESNPVWSPDGKLIAFSSNMKSIQGDKFGPGIGAIQNIWLIDPDDPVESARQLTQDGGVMPAFSPDGRYITYVSYKDRYGNGNVYITRTDGSEESIQMSKGPGIDMHPSFSPDGRSLVFTRIDSDSNNDGRIDRKDSGTVIKMPLRRIDSSAGSNEAVTEQEGYYLQPAEFYNLTLKGENVFDTGASNFVNGSILFAFNRGDDINIAFIPDTGIIPVKDRIDKQYRFAERYRPGREAFFEQSTLSLSGENKETAHQRYLMALAQVERQFKLDTLYPVYGYKAELDRLYYLRINNLPGYGELLSQIRKKIDAGDIMYRVLIDLDSYDNKEYPGLKYSRLEEASNAGNYIRRILKNRNLSDTYTEHDITSFKTYYRKYFLPEKPSLNSPLTEAEEKQMIRAYENYRKRPAEIRSWLYEQMAADLKKRGKPNSAQIVNQRLLRDNPSYYRAGEIIFETGRSRLESGIPPELLFLIYPEKYPYVLSESEEEIIKAPAATATEELRKKTLYLLYDFFREESAANRFGAIQTILEKYERDEHPELHYMADLAAASVYAENNDAPKAEDRLAEAAELIPSGTRFAYLAEKTRGFINELNGQRNEAYRHYAGSINIYDKEYDDPAIENIAARLIDYYEEKAVRFRNKGDYKNAWQNYRNLSDLLLRLYGKNVNRDRFSRIQLNRLIDINNLAFRSAGSDDELLEEIKNFYDKRIDYARRYLNNSFIFGRAHLNTQMGIILHSYYEKKGIDHNQKEKVLKLFKKAETDFKWSFFADPYFADSYVMLGWMYQYIDEKRQKIIDAADQTRDKDKFSALYSAYFPDYLFEENINLYQKSIAFFEDRISERVLKSFYLNMANNYFLLNNYAKAEESFEKLMSAGRVDYEFDSVRQKALFHFHLGKTYFFTDRFGQSLSQLLTAMSYYEDLAPLSEGSIKQKQANQKKREKILRYLALSSEYSGRTASAMKYYRQIIDEQNIVGVVYDRSFIRLELARLQYNEKNFEEAFRQTLLAEEALKREDEIEPPEFPIRIKWFGIYQPWTEILSWFYTMHYDNVYIGENRLSFRLPTVNRYQYLYSLRADIYRDRGMQPAAIASLQKLAEVAEKDESIHGLETLSAGLMRLGMVQYEQKQYNESEATYRRVLEIAQDEENLELLKKARKNLLTIAAARIENTAGSIEEKKELAQNTVEQIDSFKTQYVNARLEQTEELKQETNENLTLTEEERAKTTLQSTRQIYRLLMYKGVFLTYLGDFSLEQAENKYKDPGFEKFLDTHRSIYSNFSESLQLFKGQIKDPSDEDRTLTFLNPADHGLKLTLGMNRGRIYEILNQINTTDDLNARFEYQRTSDRAREFQALQAKALAGYRLYRLPPQSELYLKEAYETMVENEWLIRDNPDLFDLITEARVETELGRKSIARALEYEDYYRRISTTVQFRDSLGHVDDELNDDLSRLRYLRNVKQRIQQQINRRLLRRLDTTVLGNDLTKLREELKQLKGRIASYPEGRRFLPLISAPQQSGFLQSSLKYSFLYILRTGNNYRFIFSEFNGNRQFQQRTFTRSETLAALKKRPGTIQEDSDLSEWLKTIDPVAVIPDESLSRFNFSDIFKKPLIVDTSLGSLYLFSNNRAISSERLVQISTAGNIFGLVGGSSVDYDAVSEQVNVSSEKELAAERFNTQILDYESMADGDFPYTEKSSLPLRQMTLAGNRPTILIHSLNEPEEMTDRGYFHLKTEANLIAAVSGSVMVGHYNRSRAEAADEIQKLVAGRVIESSVSGNPAVLEIFRKNPDTPVLRRFSETESRAFREKARNRIENEEFNSALKALNRSHSAEKTAHEMIDSDSVMIQSSDLFQLRNELMFRTGSRDEAVNQWQAYRQRRESTTESEIQREETIRYITRLFRFQLEETALKETGLLRDDAELSENDYLKLLEGYYLNRVNSGYPAVFREDLPGALLPSTREDEKVPLLPSEPSARADFILERSSRRTEWARAFYLSLELKRALSLDDSLKPYELLPVAGYAYTLTSYNIPQRVSDKAGILINPGASTLGVFREDDSYNSIIAGLYYLKQKNYNAGLKRLDTVFRNDDSIHIRDLIIFRTLDTLKDNSDPAVVRQILLQLSAWGELLVDSESGPVDPNRQRLLFNRMLAALEDAVDSPADLAGEEFADAEKADLLASVFNRLLWNVSYFDPEEAATVGFEKRSSYRDDSVYIEKLDFLASLPASGTENEQKPVSDDTASGSTEPADTIKAEGKNRLSITERWQFNTAFEYYITVGDEYRALESYALYDRSTSLNSELTETAANLTVSGLVETYKNKLYFFEYSGAAEADIELLDTSDPDELNEIFDPSETGYLYLPARSDVYSSEKIPAIENRIYTTRFLIENRTLSSTAWQNKATDSAVASLARIIIGNSSSDGAITITDPPLENGSELQILTRPEPLQKVASESSSTFTMFFAGERKENIYLVFIEEFLLNLEKSGSVSEAFFATRSELTETFPIAEDRASIFLLRR